MNKGNGMKQIFFHDIRVGIIRRSVFYVGVCVLTLLSLVQLGQAIQQGILAGVVHSEPGYLDGIVQIMKGMKAYDPKSGEYFNIPIFWMCFHFYLAFLIGNYAYEDLQGFGQKVMLQIGNRHTWWSSKCVWCILSVTVYYGMMSLIVMLYMTFLYGARGGLSPEITAVIQQMNIGTASSGRIITAVIILPWLTSVTLCMLQMCVSIMAKPIYAYSMVIVILVASAYFKHPLLIGNGAMLMRNADFTPGGIGSMVTAAVDVVIIIAVSIGGYFYMKKCNILERGDM